MDTFTILILAVIIGLLLIAAVWWLRGRYDKLGLSTEETALKALDKAAEIVADMKEPGPDAAAAAAATAARKQKLVQSIQAHISKL